MYAIITTPNPILLQQSTDIKKVDAKIREIVEKMKVTLDHTTDPKGVGLAAPQVGLSLNLFLAKPTDNSKHVVFINPKVIAEDENEAKLKKSLLEGCLSIPTIWGKVKRKKEITLEYLDETGKLHQRKFKGFLATIIQHEIDHLNGVLFTKRTLEQGEKLYRSYKNDKGEEEFEEIKV